MITADQANRLSATIGSENKLKIILKRISESANNGDSEILFGDKYVGFVVEKKLTELGYEIKRQNSVVCVSW